MCAPCKSYTHLPQIQQDGSYDATELLVKIFRAEAMHALLLCPMVSLYPIVTKLRQRPHKINTVQLFIRNVYYVYFLLYCVL